MDYRDSFRSYDRPDGYDDASAGYKHPMEDAFDRSRKRGRSPSPTFDRYASDRRASAYGSYPPVDPWDRERDYPARERSPYASARPVYDEFRESDPYDRERERALEWERYYRERDAGYADDYGQGDRERYESRRRYDDDGGRPRDDRRFRERDRSFTYGTVGTPQRRDGPPDFARDGGGSYRNNGDVAPPPDPLQSDYLLPFRSFAQMTKAAHPSARDRTIDQPTTQELYDGYQVYRLAFQKRAMEAFFEQRKDEAWFKEKYHSADDYTEARQKRKRAGRAGRKEAWLDELSRGRLDTVSFDLKSGDAPSSGAADRAAANNDDDDVVVRGDAADETDFDGREDKSHRRRADGESVLTSRYGEAELVSGDQVTIPATEYQILVKSFPPDISREKLENHLQTRPGYRYLALGEPHSGKKWHRVGWAIYDDGTDMDETVKALDGKEIDGFTVHLALSTRPSHGKLRTVPEFSNSFARLIQDLNQAKALVQKFEEEDRTVLFEDEAGANVAWVQTNASDAISARQRELDPHFTEDLLEQGYDAEEDAERREARRNRLKRHLDWHLDLLRHVYHCDYYLSLSCEFQEELLRRSPWHVRRQAPPGTLVEEPRDSTNDESWAKSVDQKTNLLLSDEKADLTEFGGKSIEAELLSAALPFVKEEETEKHRCIVEVTGGQCGKLFKAAIFVQKHVMNKHRAFLGLQSSGRIQKARFFNNYVRDPCRPQAPAGQPVSSGGSGGPSGTPLSHRFAGLLPDGTPTVPSPLFNSSRVGLIRLGGSTAATDSPGSAASPYGAGRRPTSPSRRLSERMGGMLPQPSAAAALPLPMMMNMGMNFAPSPAVGGAGPPLGMRIGALAPGSNGRGAGMAGGGGGMGEPVKAVAEPLPDPPKPLDPRAARAAPKSYTDLDGPAAQGDVDDLAY